MTPSPNIRHQRISKRLFLLIEVWLQEHPLGEVFYAPLDVRFSMFDVVEPDLLYVSNERAAALLAGEHVTGSPDLIIEIGSPALDNATRRSSAGCTNARTSSSTGSSIRTST